MKKEKTGSIVIHDANSTTFNLREVKTTLSNGELSVKYFLEIKRPKESFKSIFELSPEDLDSLKELLDIF